MGLFEHKPGRRKNRGISYRLLLVLAALLLLIPLALFAGGCQTKAQPGPTTTGQSAPASQPESTADQPSPSGTPRPTVELLPGKTKVAVNDEPAATQVNTPESVALKAPAGAEPSPTRTPPQVAAGQPTPPTAIPTAVGPIPADPAITNIVLAGNDVRWPQGGRTDALLIVSINRESKQAAVLSLPRDLYVYIPGWTMNRINLALPHGHGVDYPGGGGGLLADTIEYNFGLTINHYARLGFDSFSQVVDTLGGVEVVVNCPLTDWRLISPELDPEIEENWERFTLEPGIQEMNGDLALWYARSRRSTNDFDRGRRQQQMLGAILAKGVSLDLVDDVPELWQTFRGGIETDLNLPDLLTLAAMAPAVNENGVQHLLLPAEAFQAWRVPVTGEAVQLPRWDAVQGTFESLVSAPTLNRGQRPPLEVELVTDDPVLFRQAAENLNWHGLETTYRHSEEKVPAKTQITYHGSTLKGSFHWLVAWLFGLDPESVVVGQAPDAGSDQGINYTVVLGRDYSPCLPDFLPPAELFSGQ